VEEGLKRRLVGAAVLAVAAVMVLPRVIKMPATEEEVARPDLPTVPAQGHLGRVRPLVAPAPTETPVAGDPGATPTGQAPNMLPLPLPETLPPQGVGQPPPPGATEPLPSGPRTGVTGWVVQVGSFASKENADRLGEELRGRGFQGFVEDSDVRGQKIYRVLVGPEVQKEGAERTMQRMAEWMRDRKLAGRIKSYP